MSEFNLKSPLCENIYLIADSTTALMQLGPLLLNQALVHEFEQIRRNPYLIQNNKEAKLVKTPLQEIIGLYTYILDYTSDFFPFGPFPIWECFCPFLLSLHIQVKETDAINFGRHVWSEELSLICEDLSNRKHTRCMLDKLGSVSIQLAFVS